MNKFTKGLKSIVLILFAVSPILGTAGYSDNALHYTDTADSPYGEVIVVSEGINPRDLSTALSKVREAGLGTPPCVVYNLETEDLTDCSADHLLVTQAEIAQYYNDHSPQVALSKHAKIRVGNLVACGVGGLALGLTFGVGPDGVGGPVAFVALLGTSAYVVAKTCWNT